MSTTQKRKAFIVKNIFNKHRKLNKLGEGTYGKVYKCEGNVAIKKCIIFSGYDEDNFPTAYVNEISILKYLNHPNIINICQVQMNTDIAFSMPLCNDLHYERNKSIRKNIIYQIFRGVEYFHSMGVIHNDIKISNILIDNNNNFPVVKICDFGCALHNTSNERMFGTLWYRSPETMYTGDNVNELSDIWSVGICILEMIYEFCPIRKYHEYDMMHKICIFFGVKSKLIEKTYLLSKSNIMETKPKHYKYKMPIDEDEKEVIQSCLTWIRFRKSASEIMKMKYFDDVIDEIETKIPVYTENTTPKVVNSNYRLYEPYIKRIKQKTVITTPRRKCFGWLHEIMKESKDIDYKILYHAVELLDRINSLILIDLHLVQMYTVSCLVISNNVKGIYKFILSEAARICDNAYTVEQLIKCKEDILKLTEFEIVFDSIYDDIMKSNNSEEDKNKLLDVCYVVNLLNDDKQYNNQQIISLGCQCLGIEKITTYTQDIRNKLIDILMTDGKESKYCNVEDIIT